MLPSVADLKIDVFSQFRDDRGVLVPFDVAAAIPFPIVRFFWIFDVPLGTTRGAHAHKRCHQYYICGAGSLRVEAYDGQNDRILTLNAGKGLYIPPAIFTTESFSAPNSILIVFCSSLYEIDDYIRDRGALISFRSSS
jgi:dTDP-4-dehydrorhamnose 3,5-epimerase-like enzyme